MPRVLPFALLVLAACAPDDEEDVAERFLESARIQEGSPEARGVLTLVNEATFSDLDDDDRAGLVKRTATNIMGFRAGDDGQLGTADDRRIDTLATLDAVPWVGKVAFERLLVFASAQGLVGEPACTVDAPRAGRSRAYVTPEDGGGPLLALIDGARHGVDVVAYQMTATSVIDALIAAAGRGARVRVILDRKHPSTVRTRARLEAGGVAVALGREDLNYTHQKTLIVDHRTALVFSGNFDASSLERGRNIGIIQEDWQDIADLTRLFDADWAAASAELDCTRLVVAPVNARARLLALVNGAKARLEVEALYVTDAEMVDALIAAHQRGVVVRVLLNDPQFGFSDDVIGKRLVAAGIDARRSGDFFIHAKLLVADGASFFVGSENFSWNSLERNREAGVVLDAAAFDSDRIMAAFEKDFAASVRF